MPSGLCHIVAAAGDFGAVVLEDSGASAVVRASPWQPGGGTPVVFRLLITSEGGRIRAREHGDTPRLPLACPQRHLNHDGTFCLGWGEEDPSFVQDAEDAHAWWGSVIAFLDRQLYAESRRRWPRGEERAHGQAAEHEAEAEVCAAKLGPEFLSDLRRGHMGLRRSAKGSLILERRGRRLFAMRETAETVANLRAGCPCTTASQRLVLKGCGDHAQVARRLIQALAEKEGAEERFMRDFARHTRCCGTMDGCPLNSVAKQFG